MTAQTTIKDFEKQISELGEFLSQSRDTLSVETHSLETHSQRHTSTLAHSHSHTLTHTFSLGDLIKSKKSKGENKNDLKPLIDQLLGKKSCVLSMCLV